MSHFNTDTNQRPDLGQILIVVVLRTSRGFSKQSAEVLSLTTSHDVKAVLTSNLPCRPDLRRVL
jgi:hypothetical protein